MSKLLIPDLQPGRTHMVEVRAVNPDGASEWSSRYSLVVINDTTTPKTPTSLTFVPTGNAFTASWDYMTQNLADEEISIVRYELELTGGGITKIISVPQTTGTQVLYTLSLDENRALFTTQRAVVAARVRAVSNIDLKSAWSAVVTGTNPAPAAPTAVVATAGESRIALSWTPPADVDVIGYNVYNGASKLTFTSATTFIYHTTTYSSTTLTVKAVDIFLQESTGANSNAVTPTSPFTADTTAPAIPTGLTATLANNASGVGARATLGWTMSSPPSDLAGFYVRFRKVGDTVYSNTTFQKDDRAGIIEVQAAYQNYEFQIKAFDWSNNESAWSATVTATSPSNTAPANIASMTATPGVDAIRYDWTAVADADLKEYEVTFSTSSTFASGNITFKTGIANTLTVSGLAPSTTYYARVRAVDTGGLTSASWSATNTSATTAFPSASLSDGNPPASSPTPTVTGGIGNLFVNWTGVTNADPVTYEVHVSTTTGFTPAAGTKVGETDSTFVVLEKDGAGTQLAYGTTYYVKLIAKDRDGAAAAGTQGSGSPVKSALADISATARDLGANITTTSATAPSSPIVNDIWNDTTSGYEKYWNGSAWVLTGNASLSTVVSAQFINTNPTFSDWTGTYPVGTTSWTGAVVKETSIVRTAPNAVRFNTDGTTNFGINSSGMLSGLPLTDYVYVEADAYLVSGTSFSGSGVLLDWNGTTAPTRDKIRFDTIAAPVTGKWYRFGKVLKRPNAGGTHTSWTSYIMGDFPTDLGPVAAKNIIIDRVGFRPASPEEITAYNTVGYIATAKAEAITDADAKDAVVLAEVREPPGVTNLLTASRTFIGSLYLWLDAPNGTTPSLVSTAGPFMASGGTYPNVNAIRLHTVSATNRIFRLREVKQLGWHTVSFWYKRAGASDSGFNVDICDRVGNATGSTPFTATSSWQFAQVTTNVTTLNSSFQFVDIELAAAGGEILVYQPQLELGRNHSAYSASPEELAGDLTNAVATSASGKNKITYSTSAPVNGTNTGILGDTWFVRDATTLRIKAQYELTTAPSTWTSRLVDGIIIANLDAGVITAGFLDAARIQANTITATKLNVTVGGGNFMKNSTLKNDLSDWALSDSYTPASTISRVTGVSSPVADTAIQHSITSSTSTWGSFIRQNVGTGTIKSGQKYVASFYARNISGTATVSLAFQNTAGGSNVSGGTQGFTLTSSWARYTYSFTATADSVVDTLWYMARTGSPSPSVNQFTGFQLELGDVPTSYTPKTDEILPGTIVTDMLAASAVTAAKIAANTITANEIAADAITASELAAGAVTASKLLVSVGGGNLLPHSQFRNAPLDQSIWQPRYSRPEAISSVVDVALGTPRALEIEVKSGMSGYPNGFSGYGDTGTALAAAYRPQVPPLTPITISAWVKRVAGTGSLYLTAQKFNSSGTYLGNLITQIANSTNTTLGEWKRFVGTATTDATTDKLDFLAITNDTLGTVGDIWRVKNVQFELGDVATAYAPKADEILPGTIVTNMINAGAVTAAEIAAGAVTAEKLTVGATTIGDNLILNGSLEELSSTDPTLPSRFARGGWPGGVLTGGAIDSTQKASGTYSYRLDSTDTVAANSQSVSSVPQVPVSPGDTYYMSVKAKGSAGTGGLYVRPLSQSGAEVSNVVGIENRTVTTSWQTFEGIFTVPAGWTTARLFAVAYRPSVSGLSSIWVDDFVMRKVITGTVIADGAITTGKIVANAITAASGIIADAAITTAKIADLNVTTAKIALLAVTNAQIANATITSGKISDLSADKITAGTVGSGFGITMAAGSSILLNGGYLKSNTYTGTTQASNPSGAGFYLGNDGLRIDTGIIDAAALESGTAIIGDLTIGRSADALGEIKSFGYSAGVAGFRLHKTGLEVNTGTIKAAALQIQAAASNMVPAQWSTFELPSTYYSTSVLVVNGASGTAAISTTQEWTGTQSLRLQLTTTATANGYIEYLGLETIPVQPSTTYIISAYVYQEAGTASDSQVMLVVDGSASGGSYAAPTGGTGGNHTIATINAWVRYSWYFTTGASQVGVRLRPRITKPGAQVFSARNFYVDGIMMEEKMSALTTPSAYNTGGLTAIDGGMIKTGSITSTATALITQALPEYDETETIIVGYTEITTIPDPSGRPAWTINANGSAEFSNLSIRGNAIVGHPGTGYTVAAPVTIAANTTSGTKNITNAPLDSFKGADVGLAITGAGIPAGTVIATVIDSTSITISANATATGTAVALSVARVKRQVASLSSPDYVPGYLGWTIRSDGYAEFRDLAADSVDADVLKSDTVNGEHLHGIIDVQSTLMFGSNINLSPLGMFITGPQGVSSFPTDGSDIILRGNVSAQSVSVDGKFTMSGQSNSLSKGSELEVMSGTVPPTTGPEIVPYLPAYAIHAGYYGRGVAPFAADTAHAAPFLMVESVFDGSITTLYKSATTGAYEYAFKQFNMNTNGARTEIVNALGGVAAIGTEVYTLCQTNEAHPTTGRGRWYIYQWHFNGIAEPNNTRFSFVRRTLFEPSANGANSSMTPAIGSSGTNVIVVQGNSNTNWYYYSLPGNTASPTITGLALRNTDGTQFKTTRNAAGVVVGAFDGDPNMIYVLHASHAQVYVYNPTSGNRTLAHEFKTPSSTNYGFAHNGTRFISRAGTFASEYSLINNTDLSTVAVKVAQTWRLADATGPDYAAAETAQSEATVTFTFPKRNYMLIRSGTSIPDSPLDATDADSVSFYIERGTGGLKRLSTPPVGVTEVILDTINTSGAAPPWPTYGFTGETPAIIYSTGFDAYSSYWFLEGSGAGRAGPLKWDEGGRQLSQFPRQVSWGTNNASLTAVSPADTTICIAPNVLLRPGYTYRVEWVGALSNSAVTYSRVRFQRGAGITTGGTTIEYFYADHGTAGRLETFSYWSEFDWTGSETTENIFVVMDPQSGTTTSNSTAGHLGRINVYEYKSYAQP